MKSYTTQQEIILVNDTEFLSRQNAEKGADESSRKLPAKEKLQQACWNGLIEEKLPELFIPIGKDTKLYLWQLREAVNFHAMEMGEFPKEVDPYYSIDPYFFMQLNRDN